MDVPAIRKQLKIKVGIVRRLRKEHTLYKNEVEEQKEKLDKLTTDGTEEWYIKNATRMLEESTKMVGDSGARLSKAVGGLRDLVASVKQKADMNGDEELVKAEEVLGVEPTVHAEEH